MLLHVFFAAAAAVSSAVHCVLTASAKRAAARDRRVATSAKRMRRTQNAVHFPHFMVVSFSQAECSAADHIRGLCAE